MAYAVMAYVVMDAKVGLITGWASSSMCLLENGQQSGFANEYYYSSGAEVIQALKDGKIDLAFVIEFDDLSYLGDISALDKAGTPMKCQTGGLSLMAREDSLLPSLFDNGLAKLMGSQEYGDICCAYAPDVVCLDPKKGTKLDCSTLA